MAAIIELFIIIMGLISISFKRGFGVLGIGIHPRAIHDKLLLPARHYVQIWTNQAKYTCSQSAHLEELAQDCLYNTVVIVFSGCNILDFRRYSSLIWLNESIGSCRCPILDFLRRSAWSSWFEASTLTVSSLQLGSVRGLLGLVVVRAHPEPSQHLFHAN